MYLLVLVSQRVTCNIQTSLPLSVYPRCVWMSSSLVTTGCSFQIPSLWKGSHLSFSRKKHDRPFVPHETIKVKSVRKMFAHYLSDFRLCLPPLILIFFVKILLVSPISPSYCRLVIGNLSPQSGRKLFGGLQAIISR